jgi:hypothetical protein
MKTQLQSRKEYRKRINGMKMDIRLYIGRQEGLVQESIGLEQPMIS